MRRLLHGQPITIRITLAFLAAMVAVLGLTAVVLYERLEFSLNRTIRDVPTTNRAEIMARRHHRDEALHELLAQMAVAFSGTLVISGLVGYRVARAALDPVERLRRRAAAASADASFRLPVPDTADELSRLAETLNELLARVEASVAREHRLVADASHELRTPLARLRLQIDLALSRPRTTEELHDALEHARVDVADLARLADDLLLLARADDGRLPLRAAPLDADVVLHDAAERFRARAGDLGRSVRSEPAPGLQLVADPDRVAQMLDNLVDNALKHGAGTVTIAAGPAGRFVRLQVSDEGAGFPDRFLPHAFERFATAAPGRSAASAGLGMAIVAALAGAHGGAGGAGNAPEGGARVWVDLPTAV
jgi:two-component system, OmpR family, sensor kinase